MRDKTTVYSLQSWIWYKTRNKGPPNLLPLGETPRRANNWLKGITDHTTLWFLLCCPSWDGAFDLALARIGSADSITSSLPLGTEPSRLFLWSWLFGVSVSGRVFTKLGRVRWCSFRIPARFKNRSMGDLKHGKHDTMMPTCSSSFASSDGLTVACIGSPLPKLGKPANLLHATPVAARLRAMRTPRRIFSEVERLRVRIRRMGIRERTRSITTKVAAMH